MSKQYTTRVKPLKIKRDDTVRILAGKDRGKKGKVIAVLPSRSRVVVDGVNVVKKHVRARRAGQKGQRVSMPAPVHVSGVELICPKCDKGTRVGIVRENSTRQRVCKKCNAVIEE
jgi:large subunit ribosomal protein L24